MTTSNAIELVLEGWRKTVAFIASGHATDFSGRMKERQVFRRVRQEISELTQDLSLALERPFERWHIDLVAATKDERLAVEGKFKVQGDGAIPDNRKAAFYDLFKLERYVDSGNYSSGLFLWLTDEDSYRRAATGDSRDFSTHHGRVYEPGKMLRAVRSRSEMPLPLSLTRRYEFSWQRVSGPWYALELSILAI